MKKNIMRMLCVMLVMLMLLSFAACDGSNVDDGKTKIGVIQYMSHPSLDNCYAGIEAALAETCENYTIDRQIGSANSAGSDCVNYARNMVSRNYDIIIAIATPAAQAAFAAVTDTDIPVIFCAVSDPVAAGLVMAVEDPGYNCTGTSDVLDLQSQVDMIQAFQPDVKTIGVIYTSSEANSVSNLANFRQICEAEGVAVEAVAVQNPADIPGAAEALAAKVDCINNFTDNNVVQNLSVVLAAAEKHNIPVYGSEVEQVKNGCLAAMSIDYVAVGKATGNLAAEALVTGYADMLAVEVVSDATPVYNPEVMGKLGLQLPADYANAEAAQ